MMSYTQPPGGPMGLGPVPASGGSDTQSEASSAGLEELHGLVALLGVASVEDICQERFRVDRKKLEQMLTDDSGLAERAEQFFQKIMDDTNTLVSWPSRLKIGAKSKKDPHIRIAGLPQDVRVARERVLAMLDARGTRVTMKLDVSYTEHSHIIGRGGLTIKRVMDETGCHIHFPDSNRSNPTEKSNQVSIAGDMTGVEQARARVRALTPLIFAFELPVLGPQQPVPDPASPYVQRVMEQYGVQVSLKTRPKLHATLVVVKGCEAEVKRVKEATKLLVDYMCDSCASQILVQMTLEISPQHHSVVLGRNASQLRGIMGRTGAQILFPDASDPNTPPLKRSCITISGHIHAVYSARQQLMGSLPLVLMFDLPEHVTSVDAGHVAQLMATLDVLINIRHKPKQHALSVVVKGVERNAINVYTARHQLLGLKETCIMPDIPMSYHVPVESDSPPSFPINGQVLSQSSGPLSPILSPMSPLPPWPALHAPFSFSIPSMNTQQHIGSALPSSVLNDKDMHNLQNINMQNLQHMQNLQNMLREAQSQASLNGTNGTTASNNTSGYNTYSSANSSAGPTSPQNSFRTASPNNSQYHQHGSTSSAPSLGGSNAGSASKGAAGVYRGASTSVKKRPTLEMSYKPFLTPSVPLTPNSPHVFDYDQKALLAIQARHNRPTGELRVPTGRWSGLGFSCTTPDPLDMLDLASKLPEEDDEVWTGPPTAQHHSSVNNLGFSSALDYIPTNLRLSRPSLSYAPSPAITNGKYKDLDDLLVSIGQAKYSSLFANLCINIDTFCKLTDTELKDLGVTSWPVRRRMVIAAAEQACITRRPLLSNEDLNFEGRRFSGSAAPGAERRTLSSDGW